MNREIKFRAWSEKGGMRQLDQITMGDKIWTCENGNGVSLLYQPHVKVMQFTGLKDKNGNEIYEGDILAYPSAHPKHSGKIFNNVVEFASGQTICGWRMRNKSCIVKATHYKFAISEIIGNIYEHPNLIALDKTINGSNK